MAGSSRVPSPHGEQVVAKEVEACAELAQSWGLAAGEQRQEIWATSFGALRWSLEEELRLAGKELTALRRAALDRLLQDERRQQQRELRRCGKAFHAERL